MSAILQNLKVITFHNLFGYPKFKVFDKFESEIIHVYFNNLYNNVRTFSYETANTGYLSRVMIKPAFCICENEGALQLLGNHAADQHLCFRYVVQSLLVLNLKFQASIHLSWLYNPVCVVTGRKTPKTVFLLTMLICH